MTTTNKTNATETVTIMDDETWAKHADDVIEELTGKRPAENPRKHVCPTDTTYCWFCHCG